MSGIDHSSVVALAFVLPPLYGAVGAWLSHLGNCEGAWDEFFSTWPFASIGAVVAAVYLSKLGS
jgi:hypothetical protein